MHIFLDIDSLHLISICFKTTIALSNTLRRKIYPINMNFLQIFCHVRLTWPIRILIPLKSTCQSKSDQINISTGQRWSINFVLIYLFYYAFLESRWFEDNRPFQLRRSNSIHCNLLFLGRCHLLQFAIISKKIFVLRVIWSLPLWISELDSYFKNCILVRQFYPSVKKESLLSILAPKFCTQCTWKGLKILIIAYFTIT